MIVPCECGAKLKIDDTKMSDRGVKVRCPRCGAVLSVQKPTGAPHEVAAGKTIPLAASKGPLVLIAHDSVAVRSMISGVLVDAGFRVDTAADGLEVLKKATETRPEGLVLDVGLPGIYVYELCERLKGDPDNGAIKIVFLSSVYDMKRYKRTPVNLYGADDYIEKHHIHDLPAKLRKLIYPEHFTAAPAGIKTPSHHDLPEPSRPPAREFQPSLLSPDGMTQMEQDIPESVPHHTTGPMTGPKERPITPESFSLEASIFQRDEFDIPKVDEADPDAVEKAKRFARIIVSDIALYNQEAVIEGIKSGTFYELLKNDVQEGRELYEKRVPAVIKKKKDYFQQAFDNFIAAARLKS